MMNGNMESKMDEQRGVYEVEYYWQDGYEIWHRECVYVVADSGEHAMKLGEETVYMPYGANGAEYIGQASEAI